MNNPNGLRQRWMKSVLLAAALLAVWAGGTANAQTPEEIIAQAQALSDQEKYEEANKLLMDLAQAQPAHPDVYWKIAQNFYDLGERIDIKTDKAKKLEMYKKCEEWAKKGYDKNPNLADNAFWMAVGISQQAQTNGIAKTIMTDRKLPKRIEDYYLQASKATDFHYKDKNSDTVASAHYALGIFYRKIPAFPGVTLLLGTSGDLDKSVEHTKIAHEMYPQNIEFTKEAGVSLLCRGVKNNNDADIEAGKKFLRDAIALPAETALDRIDQADAQKLIDDPKLACGYSRVQQEEVSADSIK